jgi:hypothetical protein
MMRKIAILILVISLCGCSDERPELEEARRYFEILYPETKVVDIRIVEDEVIARSFKFRYRHTATNQEGEMEIQFMEAETKEEWIPRPTPPKTLR